MCLVAVVFLRQQERQWARERERSEELQSTTESHYTAQLQHLQHQLQAVEKERNICMVRHLLLKLDVPCSCSHPHAVERERNICMVRHLLLTLDVPCSYSHPHAVERERNICMVRHLLLEFDVVWIFTLGSTSICALIKIP